MRKRKRDYPTIGSLQKWMQWQESQEPGYPVGSPTWFSGNQALETTLCCLPTEHWQQAGSKMEQPELGVELNGMLVTEAAVFTH